MARDELIDMLPGGIGSYSWSINHNAEDDGGKSATIQRTAPVSGMGFVYQLSESSPLVFRWKGTILRRSQLQRMWEFYNVCNGGGPGSQRTIKLNDFQGGSFEVLFSAFNPVRERVAFNPRAESEGDRCVKWSYSAQFDVIQVFGGWP